jgi:hypothetical protein
MSPWTHHVLLLLAAYAALSAVVAGRTRTPTPAKRVPSPLAPSPSPKLLPTSAPVFAPLPASVAAPSGGGGISTTVPHALPNGSAVVLLDQRLYNESCSVPAWVRTDATPIGPNAALPTSVVADDFFVPPQLDACRTLTVDVGLLRAMGRNAGWRAPSRATLYVWADVGFPLGSSWGVAAPLVEQVFFVPTEPAASNWASAAYGYTVDTPSVYNHVESLRFTVTLPANTPLTGGWTYWVGLSVALDRAYNASDFSQNQPRWMTTTGAALRAAQQQLGGQATQAYRVIDAQAPNGASMFRAAPQLANWSTADDATEAAVLPFLGSTQPQRSDTRQLALGVFASDCTAYTTDGLLLSLSGVPGRVVDAVRQAQWPPPQPPLVAVPAPRVTPPPPPQRTTPVTVDDTPTWSSSSSPNGGIVTQPEGLDWTWLGALVGLGCAVLLVLVGVLALVARRCHRQHYQTDTSYHGLVQLVNSDGSVGTPAPDAAAAKEPLTALDEDPDAAARLRLPAEVAVKATYADDPGLVMQELDDDPPDVQAAKREHGDLTMTPVPLKS